MAENVGQVLKNSGMALILCLMTIWLQMLGLMKLFSDNPFRNSGLIVFFLICSGVVFCLLIGLFTRLFINKGSITPAWLLHMARELATRLNTAIPEVHTVTTAGLNAFAVDNLSRHGHILFHRQIFVSLTHDEVEAILAHELCHIAKGHAGVLTLMQGMMLPVALPLALISVGLASMFIGLRGFSQNLLRLNSIYSLLLFPLTSLLLLLFSRAWEYQADSCAASLVGKQQYLQTLRCLHGSFFQHPNLLNQIGKAPIKVATKTQVQPKSQEGGFTHPSLAQRINALQEIGL
jgi:heat shock protein HtpX